MTTPYGTTTFRHEPGNTSATFRLLEAVDPMGGTEWLEFHLEKTSWPATEPSNLDDTLASTGFTNETIATPDISHTYDAYYPRWA